VTPQETAKVLRRFHAAYGNEITADMASLWAESFSGNEAILVEDAADEWIRERVQFPTPADIRNVMRSIMSRMDRHPELPRNSAQVIDGPHGGFQIAYDAYCETVKRDNREPKTFDQFIGLIPVDNTARQKRSW